MSIRTIEKQRRMASGGSADPMQLRLQMIDDRDDEMTDAEILDALERMNDEDRWRGLELLPDEIVARLFGSNND
jgi:hypothetical protein